MDLPGCFPRAVDDLRGALAQAPVVVHLGEAQLLEGLHFQGQNRLVHRALALGHLLQKGAYLLLVHLKDLLSN